MILFWIFYEVKSGMFFFKVIRMVLVRIWSTTKGIRLDIEVKKEFLMQLTEAGNTP